MRSLPLLPFLLLALGAAFSSSASWAGHGEPAARSGKTAEESKEDKGAEARTEKKPNAKDKKRARDERIAVLRAEREKTLEELTALEEGWSDLEGEDGEPTEAQLKERLDMLTARLDALDKEIQELQKAR
ncbi:MAG: hypothetical protein VX498_01755 [Myxococcota bacterium]|nr:hypothetical protein [Myxococcota bacterium]